MSAEAKGGNTIKAAGDVTFDAASHSDVQSLAISIAGVVADDGFGFGAAGSGSGNTIDNDVRAVIGADSVVTAGGALSLSAKDDSHIRADSGGAALAISDGDSSAAIGASIAINDIDITVRAAIEDSTVTADSVDASATGSPHVEALTIAGAVAGSNDDVAFGGAGSGSGNYVSSTIEAVIVDSTVTTTAGNLALHATDGSIINADAGSGAVAVTVGGDSTQSSVAAGAAAAYNEVRTTARAAIIDTDDVVQLVAVAGAASLEARSTANIDAFTFGFAGALSAGGSDTAIGIAGAGSGSGNSIVNTIEAAVRGSSLTTTGDVSLEAEDDSSIDAIAGSVAVSIAAGQDSTVAVGLGLSITINEVANHVLAIVDDSDDAGGDVTLTAESSAEIQAKAIGAAVSVSASSGNTPIAVGATGTGADNRITNTIRAAIEDTVPVSANTVQAGGSVSLHASDDSSVDSFGFAGAVAIAAGSNAPVSGAVGVGVAINTIANDVSAYVAHTTVDADGSIVIGATSDSEIQAISTAAALSGAVGDSGGVAIAGGGAFAQNVILTTTNAYAVDSDLEAGTALVEGDIDIDASSVSTIDASVLAFSAAVAGGGGNAVGASIGISLARNYIGWNRTAAALMTTRPSRCCTRRCRPAKSSR